MVIWHQENISATRMDYLFFNLSSIYKRLRICDQYIRLIWIGNGCILVRNNLMNQKANSLDLDQTKYMFQLIWIYTVRSRYKTLWNKELNSFHMENLVTWNLHVSWIFGFDASTTKFSQNNDSWHPAFIGACIHVHTNVRHAEWSFSIDLKQRN
jgi:hypothetical protein